VVACALGGAKSGTYDWLVCVQAISITQSGKPSDKLELAFRLYDIDRNGSIDQQEMADIIHVLPAIITISARGGSKGEGEGGHGPLVRGLPPLLSPLPSEIFWWV